jgi:predicted AlkP superfamily pyrophosphatase or phosphodiesterase
MKSVKYLFLTLFILIAQILFAQQESKPKLVVGIVIDQMRYDYLQKYEKYFGEGGFKRLMNEGTDFTFAHYDYVPTYTGPGHSSIYTGTTPYYNGIISNDWYSKKSNSFVNCVEDKSVRTIGETTGEGQKSPIRLLTTTISDQMKIATNGKCKAYSISIKDRAAILPGGHNPDEVFWYSPETGKFISSTYYTNSLPQWVIDFNQKNIVSSLFKGVWNLLLPSEDYSFSAPDEAPWEDDVFSEGKTSFPHSFSKVMGKKYDLIRDTPFGNDLLLQFAKALIENEKPGSGDYTDFLAISFSSPDFIGHAYGPNSVEIQDTYIRMDRQLADLFNSLDKNVGKGNYILFLTADHAVSETVGFLKSMKIPAEGFEYKACGDSIKSFAERKFGTRDLIENFSNLQIYFSKKVLEENKLNSAVVEDSFGEYLRDEFPEIKKIFLRHNMKNLSPQRIPDNYILNGFNHERSGDVSFDLNPNILPGFGNKGTTHGASFPYDTHVPLLFYGWDVPAKTDNTPVYIVDIAATICNMLGIDEPNGCIGIPIIKK